MKYSTATKIATILGPSDIVSDQNHIYSERGVYNTTTEQAELLDRSVLTNDGKKLTGDSPVSYTHLAEVAGLDTSRVFQKEQDEYRRCLIKSYLTDEETAVLNILYQTI